MCFAAAQPQGAQLQFGTPKLNNNMFTVSLRFLGEWRPAKALTPCLKVHATTKGHWGGSPRDSTPKLFKVVGREPFSVMVFELCFCFRDVLFFNLHYIIY